GNGGFHGLSTAWLPLAEFRPELYKLIAEPNLRRPDMRLVRILRWKNAHPAQAVASASLPPAAPETAAPIAENNTVAMTQLTPAGEANAAEAPAAKKTEPSAPAKSILVSLPTGFRH